jgi:hypothetical protein
MELASPLLDSYAFAFAKLHKSAQMLYTSQKRIKTNGAEFLYGNEDAMSRTRLRLREKTDGRSLHHSSPGHTMEKPMSATGVTRMNLDAGLQASLAHLNIRTSSHPSIGTIGIFKRLLPADKAIITSETISGDGLQQGTPKRSISYRFGYSNRADDMKHAIRGPAV